MKMAATASYSAVPSMLMVAPIGSTNLRKRIVTCQQTSITGRVYENPPADPRIHPILGLEQADGDGERGAAGARPEGRGDRVGHVGNEPEEELLTFDVMLTGMVMMAMYLKGSWRVTREKMSGSTTNPCTNSPDIGSLFKESLSNCQDFRGI